MLAIGVLAIVHPGRVLTGLESEFDKLIVEKGERRWWCCGRRRRTKIDPDFMEMEDQGVKQGRSNEGRDNRTERKTEAAQGCCN